MNVASYADLIWIPVALFSFISGLVIAGLLWSGISAWKKAEKSVAIGYIGACLWMASLAILVLWSF